MAEILKQNSFILADQNNKPHCTLLRITKSWTRNRHKQGRQRERNIIMHNRMQSVCEKNKSLSCFYWFCVCAFFAWPTCVHDTGKRVQNTWNTKCYIIDTVVTAIPFWVTFGSSCVKQKSCCLVFAIFVACSTCTVGHKTTAKCQNRKTHTILHIYSHKNIAKGKNS